MHRKAKLALTISAVLLGGVSGGGLGAAAAGAPDDRTPAGERDRPARVVAPVTLKPFGGQQASGVARLSASPGRTAGIIAILIGLTADPTDPSGTVYRFAAGAASCEQLPPDGDASALRRLEPPLEVAPDGTAIVTGSVWDDTDIVHVLSKARSLAVVGDWDGDGRDEIAACGDLEKLRVVNSAKAADGLLFATAPFGGGGGGPAACGSACGDGKLLGNLLLWRRDEGASGALAVTGLAPDTDHVVGLSTRSCDEASGDPDVRPAGSFRTDATGSAVLGLFVAPVHLDLLGILVGEAVPDGTRAVACQDVTALPVKPR